MRKLVFFGISILLLAMNSGRSHAYDDSPWCARSWGGSDYIENCNMRSFAMCLGEIRGIGGNTVCSPNPNQRRAAPDRHRTGAGKR
jgi:hypothetical protein